MTLVSVRVPGTKLCWQNAIGGLLLFLSINAVLVGYWVTVTAQLQLAAASTSATSVVEEQRVSESLLDSRLLGNTGSVQQDIDEAIRFAISNRTTPCDALSIRSDVRLCLETLLPYCRSVTRCSIEPAPQPATPQPSTAYNHTTDVALANTLSPRAGGRGTQPSQLVVSTGTVTDRGVDSTVELSASDARRASSILGAALQQRLVDRRHNRTHYVCTARETIRDWNLTLRIVTYFCSAYNATHDEAVAMDQLLPAARLRWQRVARGNATVASRLEQDWVTERRLEALGFQRNCSFWLERLEGWLAAAAARITSPLQNAILNDTTTGLARFEPDMSLHVRQLWNASSALDEEWMKALRWADRHRTSAYCSADDDPWMVLPLDRRPATLGAVTACRWTHEVLMASLCTDADVAGLLDGHNLWGTRREAYGRFRAALKQRREVADAARLANASSEAPTPSDDATPSAGDEDDMLRADPALHEGCLEEAFTEVRVAVVGDSTSVAYPRRMHQWLRRLCTHCRDAKIKVHLYNFAVAARKVVGDDADRIGYENTSMYAKSLRYAPDVVVFMLGTNDALRWWHFNETQFQRALHAMLRSYLDGPTRPTLLVMLPPPAFDSVFTNHTRQASKRHRSRVYLRRVAYADGNVSRCLGQDVLASTRAVVARLAEAATGQRRRVHLVDLYDTVLQWLLDRAAKFAVEKSSYHRTDALRWFRDIVPALLTANAASSAASGSYLRGLPIGTLPMQRAIFDAMADGVHLEKSLQKVVAVEVLRQLWMPRDG